MAGRDQSEVLPAWDGSSLGFLKTVIMRDGRAIQIYAGYPHD
jgi:hypothetical protein